MNKPLLLTIITLLLIPGLVLAQDSDGDGLTDEQEARYLTDPLVFDTDGDGYSDGLEVEFGYSPLVGEGRQMHQHDADGDGLNDWLEIWFGSSLQEGDSDSDGYSDFAEVMSGYSPASQTTTQFSRELVVDRSQQRMHYMVDGVKIRNYPVSTGNIWTETPTGTYAIRRKVDVKDYRGADYFVPDVWWNMEFLPMYYIHAAYWHNDFGLRTHSHGCVNMTYDDAKELYQYATLGLPIRVIGETPTGSVLQS